MSKHDEALFRFTPAAKTGLAIAAAISLYGVSFGALAVASGLTLGQTVALSALMFTGGSQFAFIGVVATGGAAASAFGGATLLSLRNTIYAVQLKALLNPRGVKKLAAAQLTIDETMATSTVQETAAEQRRGFWITGIACYLGWNIATVIGALLGDFIAEPEALGLDGAVVAAFLGLLWPRLRSREPWALAVVAALITVLIMPPVPAGVPVLVAAAVAVIWGLISARRDRDGGRLSGAEQHGARTRRRNAQ
ncbi:AzlC family ABC transporter permease [Nesterenkonia sphaerica]|uniref:AzlC family ABC transporter permease n=1 Tax=Nesterenkonia sphaerica TaxID=1804988 RepID=UPI001FB6EAD1|nr:AzlC family ABC transporter permease [Nesterenkonia sphaerica]